MMTKPSKPNIYDVAQSSGVSHQTVSRVINGHPSVRLETRQRVLDAMASLGYVPNQAARSLVTSRTHLIGILAANTTLYGPAGGVNAMEIAAREAGYATITYSIDPLSEEDIRTGVTRLRALGVDGLIVITTHNRPAVIAREMLRDIPVVAIDAEYDAAEVSVEVDNITAASEATQYLIDLGHTGILHIAGPLASFVAKQRVEGYTTTMRRAGLLPRVEVRDWSIQAGFEIASAFDFVGQGVTAVFAANDSLALGLYRACHERGIVIPERLSVIGFDDIPEAAYFEPPLTTMRQEFGEVGKTAMTLLLRRLAGDASTASEFIRLHMVERASTARPA